MRLSEILNENEKDKFSAALKGNMPIILAYGEGSGRNLDIRGVPVTLDQWEKTMDIATDGDGYGEFEPKKVARALRKWPGATGLKYVPARENSVALYILGGPGDLEELSDFIEQNRDAFCSVDEIHTYPEGRKPISGGSIPGPVLRLWWD